MGHQVNFYATPADISLLEGELRRVQPMKILHSRSSAASPRVVPSFDIREAEHQWLFFYLVRDEDLDRVLMRHVPDQGYWTVDVLRSPVVELERCYFDGRALRRGRAYYLDGFYGADDAWIEKPESFRLWAKAILKTTRKCLRKQGTGYIGAGAARWLQESGGKLLE